MHIVWVTNRKSWKPYANVQKSDTLQLKDFFYLHYMSSYFKTDIMIYFKFKNPVSNYIANYFLGKE